MLKLFNHKHSVIVLYINNNLLSNYDLQKNLWGFCFFKAFHFSVFFVYLPVNLQIKYRRLFKMLEMMDRILLLRLKMKLFVKSPRNGYSDSLKQISLIHKKRSSYPILTVFVNFTRIFSLGRILHFWVSLIFNFLE